MGSFGSGGGSDSNRAVPASPLHVSNAGALRDGDTVTLTSTKLPADTGVIITMCLTLEHDPIAEGLDEPRCDDNTRALARTDETGHLKATYEVRRNIEIDSRPLDCSIQPGECSIKAVSVGNTPKTISTQVTIKGD
jgi:hypothetical protein